MKNQTFTNLNERPAQRFTKIAAQALILAGSIFFALESSGEIIDAVDTSRMPASVGETRKVTGESRKATDETQSIELGKRISILHDSHPIAEFQNTSQGWKNRDAKSFTNWKFFDNFIESLQTYRVDFKITDDELKPELKHFEMRTSGRIFKFVKFGDHTWAVKRPGQKDFEASRSFSFFGDMEASTWSSPLEKSLRIVKDPTAAITIRITAFRSIMDSPSADVKLVLKEVLLTEG